MVLLASVVACFLIASTASVAALISGSCKGKSTSSVYKYFGDYWVDYAKYRARKTDWRDEDEGPSIQKKIEKEERRKKKEERQDKLQPFWGFFILFGLPAILVFIASLK